MNSNLAALSVVFAIGCLGSSTGWAEPGAYIMVTPKDIKWADNPALPKGAKTAVIQGDPNAGPYIVRVKLPPNYILPAHTHPDERTVTVISGTWYHGDGDKYDATKLHEFPAGSIYGEGHVRHFGASKGTEVILQVDGPGPTGIDYVNPADDPRKK
ncbi:signal peptide protein [Pseudomonas fluorescens HK44]|uniref:Signal peptide protein n=1 Tax=Pseudomonas fluorescens HK44 TaxID=1042209 RepID=A0A010SNT2_PSEFL|nr:cupin domain-containing protein [Pseudomonas fluorescens]EXF94565.1 signal peptide protein [Pseudomonas fluorescens HK44]